MEPLREENRRENDEIRQEQNQALDKLEDLMLNALKANYSNPMEPFEKFAQRIRQEMKEKMNRAQERVIHGHRLLLKEAMDIREKKRQTEQQKEHFVWEQEMADLLPSQQAKQEIKDKHLLMKKYEEGQSLSQVLGFSDEAMITFYQMALDFLQQQRYADAADAFTFLTALSPQTIGFWHGLARSERLNNQVEAAMAAYQVLLLIEENDPALYIEAVRCCIEVGNFDRARDFLQQAIAYADARSDDEDAQLLRETASQALDHLGRLQVDPDAEQEGEE